MKNLCSLTYKLPVDVDDSSELLKRRIDQLDEGTERWQSSASGEGQSQRRSHYGPETPRGRNK